MSVTYHFIKIFLHLLSLTSPLLIFLVALIVLLGQYVGFREKWTPFDAFYWTFITAMTIGYGDIIPKRKASKILSVVICLIGLIFTGILVAVAVHAGSLVFSELRLKHH